MKPVTDPALLSQLEGGLKPVSDPAVLAQLGVAPPSPTDGMGTWDRLTAGIGQGMTDAALGAEQLTAHAPWLLAALGNTSALSRSAVDPKWRESINAQAAEKAKVDAPLLDTTAGRVGSLVGNAAATAPFGMGGSQATGALARLGSAALRGAQAGAAGGAVQPVIDEGFGAEKAKQVLGGSLGGAIVGGGLSGLGQVAEALIPSNLTARLLNGLNRSAAKEPISAEGERLAQQTGVMLTPAQVTGSKSANMAENAARQSIFSRDLAFQGDKARVQQLAGYFDRTLDGVTKSGSSPSVAGATVQQAAKSVVSKLEGLRSSAANEDFGKIRALTKGSTSIEPTNTNQLLQSIFSEASGVGTPTADALAAFAKKQLSNVDPAVASAAKRLGGDLGDRVAQGNSVTAPAQGNLDKLMQLRSYLSKVAGGQAKISGENQDRRIAAQLLGTIDQDIEAAGDKLGGDLGGMLKAANARYRGFSQQIDSVKSSPLGKILGEDFAGAIDSGTFNTIAPEAVMQRMASLRPTELGIVRGILEKEQPEAWSTLKRGLLEDAIDKAKAVPPSEGVNTPVLRPNVLVKNMGDAKKLEAVFTPRELSEIQAGLDVARRLSDRTGYNFSGTAGQSEVLGLMNRMKEGGIKAVASAGGSILGTKELARLMTNSQGRASLMELSRLPASTERARQLMAQLSAIAAAQEADSIGDGR